MQADLITDSQGKLALCRITLRPEQAGAMYEWLRDSARKVEQINFAADLRAAFHEARDRITESESVDGLERTSPIYVQTEPAGDPS